jgi:hypothetical protein
MSRAAFIPAVYTPALLAERWECSKTSIFRMIKRGDLPTIDFPHVRISCEIVDRIERGDLPFKTGVVYFIEGAGLLKIGHTTDPIYRLRALQASSPVSIRLIGSIPGTTDDERSLHARFRPFRDHGEWFRIIGPVAGFINAKGWLA